ncbi:hypothetical protein [Intrasporangium chromatireducens]|uniref:hypothetical protein n=1 Tax=Intrasporangium chromatireducens TaxID=1386088 RepID=UPI0004B66ACC|nr:hypothetical protein [Intrasporangium chromatireducens]
MTDSTFEHEAAEHDLVEQQEPVSDDPDGETAELAGVGATPEPEASEADWLEQQLPVTGDDAEDYPPADSAGDESG